MNKKQIEDIIYLLRDYDFQLDKENTELRYKMARCNICSSIDQVYYDKYKECLSINNTKKAKIQKMISLLKGGIKKNENA
jgi:hypothetical protein